jgi:hypothetical protein
MTSGMKEEKQQSSIRNKIFVSKCLLKTPMPKAIAPNIGELK